MDRCETAKTAAELAAQVLALAGAGAHCHSRRSGTSSISTKTSTPSSPTVIRPAFSRVPPAAYRLAEPGDTLDRIMIYLSAAGVVLSGAGLVCSRGGRALAGGVLLERRPVSGTAGRPGRPSTAGTAWDGERSAIPMRRSVCGRRLFGAAIAICGVVVANLYVRRNRLRGNRGKRIEFSAKHSAASGWPR